MVAVRSGARTDIGRVRSHNEDSLVAGEHIWAVADGMGGHAAGDVASDIVAQALAELEDSTSLSVETILEALALAHDRVVSFGQEHPRARGLGTTVTGLARVEFEGEDRLAIFNLGDSRVYHLVDGEFSRITVDHSEVEALIAEGIVTAEQARTHPMRNLITRSIGAPVPPNVDVWVFPIRTERFLICSDGLNGELTDDRIAALLDPGVHPDPQQAAEALVDAALAEGGRDNITVIVLDVETER